MANTPFPMDAPAAVALLSRHLDKYLDAGAISTEERLRAQTALDVLALAAAMPGDTNVRLVQQKLGERAAAGLRKYGVTTERTDLSLADWLLHLQEELMDAAVYVQAALGRGSALLTNPHTGEPRDYRDVESDPTGILIHKAGEPLRAAPHQPEAQVLREAQAAAADVPVGKQTFMAKWRDPGPVAEDAADG